MSLSTLLRETLRVNKDVQIPTKPFRAMQITKTDIDFPTFKANLNKWKSIVGYLIDYNGQSWPQRVSKLTQDGYVVLAVSTDLLAGEWSESFYGYFVMQPQEFEAIEKNLRNLARVKTNGLHNEILWMLKQGFTGEKAYGNYFNPIQTNDCEDDGVMRYITPKRTLPKKLFDALPMAKFDWESFEYRKGDTQNSQWMVILQSEFESDQVYLDRLVKVNKIIEEYDNRDGGNL